MARTIRRGKPSRNLKKYIKLGMISHENKTYWWCGCSLNGMLYWKDGWDDETTYQEYVANRLRLYHSDWGYRRGIPRYIREYDVNRQSRTHKKAIINAMKTGDFDVVLTKLRKEASWFWWD